MFVDVTAIVGFLSSVARWAVMVLFARWTFRRNHGKVINATEGLGLLIADEGHRLKNSAETKTTKALKACPAAMRLVLVSIVRDGCCCCL